MFENAACLDRPPVRPASPSGRASSGTSSVDPLGDDRADDAPLLTTERRLQRLAIVAADVGARFARESSRHDPVAWMLSPRALFDGERAIDACQDKAPFLRATLLHGLRLGLDAAPDDLDGFLASDEDGIEDGAEAEEPVCSASRTGDGTARLFTCEIETAYGVFGRRIEAFHATLAEDAEAVRRRLAVRYGWSIAHEAQVREGLDASSRLVRSLVAPAVVDWLAAIAADPRVAVEAGVDVLVERRFTS